MPAERPSFRRQHRRPPEEPDTPGLVPRLISGVLVAVSAIVVLGYGPLSGGALAFPQKLTVAIIACGAVSGLLHILGMVPQQRHLRAFASPVVGWPVMSAGLATLLTS